MQHTSSLELSKELYELSGWADADCWHLTNLDDPDRVIGRARPRIIRSDRDYANGYRTDTPAYDLGYLLRKLPGTATLYKNSQTQRKGWIGYTASLQGVGVDRQFADSPEDALCQLAIELFKSSVLKREVQA